MADFLFYIEVVKLAQTVVIDIAARLQDQTSAGVQKVRENVDRLGKSIEKMKKQMSHYVVHADLKLVFFLEVFISLFACFYFVL